MYDGIIEIFKSKVLDRHAAISAQDSKKVSHPYRALLVEDNKTNQFIAKTILEQAGFITLIAENGQEGYDCFVRNRDIIDIILMDLHMPVMNGYDSAALIRKLDSEIPIVAMTADAIAGVEDRCRSIGINHFVSKPFDPDTFVSNIASIVTSSGKLPKALQNGILEQTPEADAKKKSADEELGGIESETCPYLSEEDGLRLLGGNVTLYHTVLREYRIENSGLLAELSVQIASGNFSEAAKTVHKVKGSSGNIGAKSLNMVASKLQKALECGSLEIGELFEEFKRIFEQVMLYISKLK
jgi:CheY-like chemotaxis protein